MIRSNKSLPPPSSGELSAQRTEGSEAAVRVPMTPPPPYDGATSPEDG